jgi:hypothetical protein
MMNTKQLPAAGTKVVAIDGCGGERIGWVTEIITDRWGTHAEVLMDDGDVDTCHGLTTVGIGWYVAK